MPSAAEQVMRMPKIVVTDDDEIVRTTLVRGLQRAGYEVLAFPDAAPALDEVDFKEVDLVITDLQMPLLGEQFILMLRGMDIHVPVIVITAYLNEDRARYLKDLGVHQILEKPFRLSALFQTLKEMLTYSEKA